MVKTLNKNVSFNLEMWIKEVDQERESVRESAVLITLMHENDNIFPASLFVLTVPLIHFSPATTSYNLIQ